MWEQKGERKKVGDVKREKTWNYLTLAVTLFIDGMNFPT